MLKGNLKAKICILCFNTKCDIDFEVVEVIKEVLEIVLPKLNLKEGNKHLICSSCSAKLFAAFNFKSVCTDTEDTIYPYINSQEMPLIDLREIYLKEKGDIQFIDILENHKICRLCFQTVRYGFVSLNEVDANIIDNYIPEVNFNATKDPVICKVCSNSLVTHGTFLNSCLAAQEKNRKVCDDPVEDRECCIETEKIKTEDDWERKVYGDSAEDREGCIKTQDIKIEDDWERYKNVWGSPTEDRECCIKTQDIKIEDDWERYKNVWGSPTEDRECCIKTEEIKTEDDCESYSPTRLENAETIKNFDGRFSSENEPANNKKHLLGKVQTYTCNKCDFKTAHKGNIKRHCLRHVSLTKTYTTPKSQCESESTDPLSPSPLKRQKRMFQCETCPYRVHDKETFISHWWTHEMPSQEKVYQCDICHYRVIREDSFRRHLLTHEDSAEMIANLKGRLTRKCEKCGFQTRYNNDLLRHQLLHKRNIWKDLKKCYTTGDGELMYKCDVCIFKTKKKNVFLMHRLRHTQPKFKCHVCAYESDDKNKLTRHQEKHRLGMKTLKCDLCSYQSMWKSNFARHQLRHKEKSEVKTYNCFKCSFKSTYKVNLKRHLLRHKVQ